MGNTIMDNKRLDKKKAALKTATNMKLLISSATREHELNQLLCYYDSIEAEIDQMLGYYDSLIRS